jgi:four helix bundle protein
MDDFKDLRAWQEARELALASAKAIKKLPLEERFLLADQWRRATYSVTLNLAEGTGRKGSREFHRYLGFALGSLHELEAILELVDGLAYLPPGEMADLKKRRTNCARMVYGLIQRFK